MTITKPLYEVKAHFSKYANEVAKGNEVIVTKHNKPCVKLIDAEPEQPKKKYRELGFIKGDVPDRPDEWYFEPIFTDKELEEMGL